MPPEQKEKLKQLEALQKTLATDPASIDYFAKEIAANRKDPLYQFLGPTKFCSMLADVDSNIKTGTKDIKPPLPTYGWTTMEKVALYGYTSKDYVPINNAMREEGGKPSDPGIRAYSKHATNAMKKMPDFNESPRLYRALNPPPATLPATVREAFDHLSFKKGGTYLDYGFASHSLDVMQGNWSLKVEGTKNSKNVGPYGVWPGEREILVLPGTKFEVMDVDGAVITLKAK